MERTQKGRSRHHAVDRLVPGVPGPRLRGRGDDPRFGSAQSPVWDAHAGAALNSTTASVSPSAAYLAGSKGKLTSSNYAALAERSQDTAARDIEDLSRQGILARDAAGRSEHQLQSYRHYTRCIE